MSIYDSRLFQLGMGVISDLQDANVKMEDRIMKRWEDSKTMPRKMKKRERKDILVEYSILQYSRNLIPKI